MHDAPPSSPAAADFDVAVIGGALAGASAATLLRRLCPDARVLVVERQEGFGRKVGEATVELSGMFLTRILGLYRYLADEHLPKHGLRFWFTDAPHRGLAEMSEVGPARVSALPSFQLDRARLDEKVLEMAREAGVTVWRPAKVTAVELGQPTSRLAVERNGETHELTARWVLDASGRQTFLGRRMRLVEQVPEHPTAAAWGRWRGVRDPDEWTLPNGDPRCPTIPAVSAARRLATNHFCGYGWWCWVIPLAGGDTSIGLVYDKRLFQLPGEGRLRERYAGFVTGQAGLRDLLAGASLDDEDFLAYQQLPYRCRRYAGPGWALVGDAGSFLDPFYSPGLDHMTISVWATVELVAAALAGDLGEEELSRRLDEHNGGFDRSYEAWLDALYRDKYEILGDAELTTAAFLFDTGMYYLGVVEPVWRDLRFLTNPVLGADLRAARVAAQLMSLFRRRTVRLARFRRQVGTYGRRNVGWRFFPRRFEIERPRAFDLVLDGLKLLLAAEAEYLWHRVRRGSPDVSAPVSEPVPVP